MVFALLIAISLMWWTVGLLFLGKGEAKSTGATCGLVGAVTVIGGMIVGAVYNDFWTAGLLFAHGLLYCVVSYVLMAGIEDLRSMGNVSLTVAVISGLYTIHNFLGGPGAPAIGLHPIGATPYLAFMCAGYTVLTVEVWLNTYGKFPAKGLAWSLIIWAVVGLWVPAFGLMVKGWLPF